MGTETIEYVEPARKWGGAFEYDVYLLSYFKENTLPTDFNRILVTKQRLTSIKKLTLKELEEYPGLSTQSIRASRRIFLSHKEAQDYGRILADEPANCVQFIPTNEYGQLMNYLD